MRLEADIIRTIQLNLTLKARTQAVERSGETDLLLLRRTAMLFPNGGKTSMFFAPSGAQKWMGPWVEIAYVFMPEPTSDILGQRLEALSRFDYVSFDVSDLVESAGIRDDAVLTIRWSIQVNGEIVAEGTESCPAADKRGSAVNTIANVKEQLARALAAEQTQTTE